MLIRIPRSFLIILLLAAFTATCGEPATPAEAPPPDPARLKSLLDSLGNEHFDEREKATEELLKIGAPAVTAIAAREKDSTDAEVRARCQKLREAIGDPSATALAVLGKIEKSDVMFVRPGASRISLTKHYFTGPEFAKHLRTKAAVQNVSLTCFAGEFVEKVASESSLRQGAYTVRTNDGTEKNLRDWLSESLKLKFDKKAPAEDKK